MSQFGPIGVRLCGPLERYAVLCAGDVCISSQNAEKCLRGFWGHGTRKFSIERYLRQHTTHFHRRSDNGTMVYQIDVLALALEEMNVTLPAVEWASLKNHLVQHLIHPSPCPQEPRTDDSGAGTISRGDSVSNISEVSAYMHNLFLISLVTGFAVVL